MPPRNPPCALCGGPTKLVRRPEGARCTLRCTACHTFLGSSGEFMPVVCARGHVNEDCEHNGDCWGQPHSWCGMPTRPVPPEVRAAWLFGGQHRAQQVLDEMESSGAWRWP